MKYAYDYLIVGAGLYGATFARRMSDGGRSCLVIEKENHPGGLCHTKWQEGICVHKCGPHVFHTARRRAWDFVRKYADFNNYHHRVRACSNGMMYSFPINLQTMQELGHCPLKPEEMRDKLGKLHFLKDASNLEEYGMALFGDFLYLKFIKNYTQKQWGCVPSRLPASIIKRLPIRCNYNDSYYADDEYQGIPRLGYTDMISTMLDGIEIKYNTDFFENRNFWEEKGEKIVYTGSIDSLFDCDRGELPYRKLRFEEKRMDVQDCQGISVINYVDWGPDYTRTIEHKHFLFSYDIQHTIVSYEYPVFFIEELEKDKGIPAYPINIPENDQLYNQYRKRIDEQLRYIVGGRLAEYKYMNMDEVIMKALDRTDRELSP